MDRKCSQDCSATLIRVGADLDRSAKGRFLVLIVDDDLGMRSSLSEFLSDEGYEVNTAEDGRAGYEMAKSLNPSLIISDMRMPGMTGCEFVEALQQEDILIPVIFMTGYTDYEQLSQAIKLHPIGFVEKPFDLTSLQALVERAVQHEKCNKAHAALQTELTRRVEETTKLLQFKTERLEAEKKIVNGIISEANFGLLAVDPDSRLHLINRTAAALLELQPEQATTALGTELAGLLPEELRVPLLQTFSSVKSSGRHVEIEFSLPHKEKTIHLVAYAVSFQNSLSAIVLVMHDITEKMQLQRSLLQTSKLASIGELAAGVAHEINNPLGFVMSNCNTLKSYYESLAGYINEVESRFTETDPPDKPTSPLVEGLNSLKEQYDINYLLEDGVTLVGETLDGLSRVSKIVADLKSFARADNDTMLLADINKLIGDALNLVRNETKYKMEVITDLAELPPTCCLQNPLVQVFTNLFVNACHAAGEKGTLRIATSQSGNEIVVEISDDGVGIPGDILPRIFDPFFTTKELGKGTGMGLSISYGIMEKHGGSIEVESVVGEGTKFTICIPIRAEQPTTESIKQVEIENATAE